MNEQDHHFIDQGLDQLAEFLENELHNPDISAEIPDGAHIFHGSHDDNTFTQENVAFASKENSTAENRPKLTIIYICECGDDCSSAPVFCDAVI